MKLFQYIPKFWIFGCMIFFGSNCVFTMYNLAEISGGRSKKESTATYIQGFALKENKLIVIVDYSSKKSDSLFNGEDTGKACFEIPDKPSEDLIRLKISESVSCEGIQKEEEDPEIPLNQGLLSIGNKYLFEVPELSIIYHCACPDFPYEKKISHIFRADPKSNLYKLGDHFIVVFQDGTAYGISIDRYERPSGKITKSELEKYLSSPDCLSGNCNGSFIQFAPVNSLQYSIYYPKDFPLKQNTGALSVYYGGETFEERMTRKKRKNTYFYFPWTKSVRERYYK